VTPVKNFITVSQRGVQKVPNLYHVIYERPLKINIPVEISFDDEKDGYGIKWMLIK
jgi:hypothetical protein